MLRRSRVVSQLQIVILCLSASVVDHIAHFTISVEKTTTIASSLTRTACSPVGSWRQAFQLLQRNATSRAESVLPRDLAPILPTNIPQLYQPHIRGITHTHFWRIAHTTRHDERRPGRDGHASGARRCLKWTARQRRVDAVSGQQSVKTKCEYCEFKKRRRRWRYK